MAFSLGLCLLDGMEVLTILHIMNQGLHQYAVDAASFRTTSARWREVCTKPRRDLVPPDLLVVS